MNKTDRYLDNISTDALKQIIKFLLEGKCVGYINDQIEEFARMYPEDV